MSSPNILVSSPDLLVSSPDPLISSPDLLVSSPDLLISSPNLLVSSPDPQFPREVASTVISVLLVLWHLTSFCQWVVYIVIVTSEDIDIQVICHYCH